MLFNSFDFLLFFPIVVIIYYLLAQKHRVLWLLVASYFFYFYWEPSLVLLLFSSTIIDYFCGIKIHKSESKKISKRYLYLSVFINLGLLFFFKYLGFFTETTAYLLDFFGIETTNLESSQSYNLKHILLPVGISFYTFQTMSYSIDIYRNKIKPETNFIKYALYVSFFPQLVAGPIERASKLIPQFYKKIEINIPNIKKGMIMMAWGFFLKLVVADRLGVYVDFIYNNLENYSGLPLILTGYFFTFQIYYDFSAYTIIAIGAAKIIGFNLMHNFNKPIFAPTMADLWKRWHISLILWLRDYIYFPLIKKRVKRHWAVLIIFFANGLWHGANWTFVVWGVLNGIFLIFEYSTSKYRNKIIKQLNLPSLKPIFRFSWWLIWFNYAILTLIVFRSPSFETAKSFFSKILIFEDLTINVLGNRIELLLSITLVILVQTIHYFKSNNKIYELITNRTRPVRWLIYLSYILVMILFSVNRQNNFIYFQF